MIAAWALQSSMAAFAFAGGTPQEFCTALSTYTGRPVAVMLESSAQTIRKGEITVSEPSDVRRVVGVKFQLDVRPKGEVMGFGPKGWPRNFFQKMKTGDYQKGLELDPKAMRVVDSKFTIQAGVGKCLSLKELATKLDTKLTWEPFFEEVRFTVSCKNSRESEVIDVVAAAIGATPKTSAKGTELRMDAVAHRRRMIVMGRSPSSEKTRIMRFWEELNGEFLASLAENLTDAELLGFYRKPNQWVAKKVEPGSPLHIAAQRRMKGLVEFFTPAEDHQVSGQGVLQLLRDVDLSKFLYVELHPDGNPACTFNLSDGRLYTL